MRFMDDLAAGKQGRSKRRRWLVALGLLMAALAVSPVYPTMTKGVCICNALGCATGGPARVWAPGYQLIVDVFAPAPPPPDF
jgi:hypothetical protein